MTSIVKSREYSSDYLLQHVRDVIHASHPNLTPFLALFGCSDEVNSGAASVRQSVFGGYGGIFITRIIGSQVFYQQLKVATGKGHRSNVFEVNVHIGEMEENGQRVLGKLIGRDGQVRPTCGALAHVLEDFMERPDEILSVSKTEADKLYLDFLGTLKFRLNTIKIDLMVAENPMLTITQKNLEFQMRELVNQLRRILTDNPAQAPFFAYGTITCNRTEQPDTESLEYFYRIEGGAETQIHSLI